MRASKTKPVVAEVAAEPHKWGYVRVSTADQDPQLQEDAILAVGVGPSDIFRDTMSGAAKNRPGFASLLRAASEGDIIYVWKLDRFGRSVRQVLNTFHDLSERGVAIRCITQPMLDTSTAMGRLVITIMAAVAEMERDLIRERTYAGLAAGRARGRIGGREEKVTDAEIEAHRHLGATAGAKALNISRVQFSRRRDRIRLKQKMEQANAE